MISSSGAVARSVIGRALTSSNPAGSSATATAAAQSVPLSTFQSPSTSLRSQSCIVDPPKASTSAFGRAASPQGSCAFASQVDPKAATSGAAASASSGAAAGASEFSDASPTASVAAIRSLLSQFLPSEEAKQIYKIDGSDRLRFGDIPATQQLMDSFYGARLPGEPVYDLASWLENNYPQYDTLPKSSLYHWVSWMRDNLPVNQQRVMLAFDEYMQSESHRAAIVAQANFELSRLWDWQHRRAAAGLPPELTDEEKAVLVKAAADVAEAERKLAVAEKEAAKSLEDVLEEGLREHEAPAPAPPSEATLSLPNILSIIKKAEGGGSREDSAPAGGVRAAKLPPDLGIEGLSEKQRDFLTSLKRPGIQVRDLSSEFERRVARGQESTKYYRRVREALAEEHMERTLLQEELQGLGLDPKEAREAATRSSSSSRSPAAESLRASSGMPGVEQDATKMKVLDEKKFRGGSLVGKVQYWRQAKVLDYRTNLERLLQQQAELADGVKQAKQEEEMLLSSLQDHGYKFSLDARPPTPTLDMLTDYLQIKYQDVLLQRDASLALTQHVRLSENLEGSSAGRFSPQEITAMNKHASSLFDAIAPAPSAALGKAMRSYINYIEGLHSQGVVSLAAMHECVGAARLKAAAVGAAAAEAAEGAQGAPGPAERAALREALTGAAYPRDVLAQSAGGAPALAEAQKMWEAACSGPVFTGWAKGMQKFAEEDIAKRRAAGDDISKSMEKELLDFWCQPASFDEARKLWSSYQAAARGGFGGLCPESCGFSGTGPHLEEVLIADSKVRHAELKEGSTSSEHAELEVALKELYLAYSARHGSTLGAGAEPQPPAWGEVQLLNSSLDIGKGNSLSTLYRATSLHSLLSSHWAAVCARFGLSGSSTTVPWMSSQSEVKGGSAAVAEAVPTWDHLWSLMTAAYKSILARVDGPAAAAAGSPSAMPPTSSGPISVREGDGVSVLQHEEGPSTSWDAYIERVSEQWQQAASSSSSVQPPYPGARQVVRFRQAMVLDAATASSDHPVNRRVEMRVNVMELQKEAGLSTEAVKHIVRVAGRRRYDPETRELVLLGLRYPNREENRRWCMERLHLLIAEGHRRHPSDKRNTALPLPLSSV